VYQKILVPLESRDQPVNLDHARRLAEGLDAELILLRVVTVMPSEEPFFQQLQVEVGSAAERVRAEAEFQTTSLARRFRARGLKAQGTVLVSDKSEADAIVAHAESEGCDLIVMPTYPQSALSRWFLSSLGEKVRQRSSVPVLFVRPTP
jgi:nucleotide-binding universal stress UspA family protein